ncbi:4-hydroxy-tetrahydrodipicolinate synthase [Nakamurella flavida]|uniref:4-hydroxy-tetrahydrodipicolinate synthase n=1 Tax=Nakamurella flavida TaxID=363630 RepID=A0A939C3X6_9ACTN|nr:4-hydroxy-tetrahydrodipicolinate synthase [Nakamurella flavida]MBM9475064.1 4-hydroxy-tetrahydrodipicolinate synthase [Nakamurella flavida]MDP9776633.1 4-hydroxy-tetrahydrodipicolinate synthase [Nakamurella flavida]
MTALIAGPSGREGRPFGTVLAAMVTPFTAAGDLDLDATSALAERLVDEGNDGLVVNGTTGESPTTSDDEKQRVVRAVVEAVGDRATVVTGVGTSDTAHSIRLARQAEAAGAHGALVVTPYYSRPQQQGLLAHFAAVADATELPIMLYDIPARSVVAIEPDTLLRLAEHPRITAVKDAKGDLYAGSRVIAGSDLAYYSGDDPLTLPWLSVGGVGIVSIISHVVGPHVRAMVEATERGDYVRARAIHEALLPAHVAMGRCGGGAGLVFAKAALRLRGFGVGDPRLPQIPATHEQTEAIARDLDEIGPLR